MLSLYEILKASKTGIAPDMWTALAGANFGGAGSGAEVKELTGIPPLSFTADGTPLLDYLISGNMSHTGTPTHDNPIQPQETGERTGNLIDYTTVESTTNATATQISGGISVSGRYYVRFSTVKFTVGNAYTMSWKANTTSGTSSPAWRFHYADNTYSLAPSSGGALVAEKEVSELLLYVSTSQSCVVEFTEIMLNTGSTALPYEPYGYKLDISSANTTTPVYLGEVESTRRIKKYEFTGEESWQVNAPNSVFYTNISGALLTAENVITSCCSHYVAYGNQSLYLSLPDKHSCIRTSYSAIWIKDTDIATVEDFVTYLQQQYANGTPVTIWYVLATPTTGIVNEPLRKIGDYADTLSMEQAGVSIPTLNGQTVVDVDTTLKPSEVYIKYNG